MQLQDTIIISRLVTQETKCTYQTNRLRYQSPASHEMPYDKAAQNRLDLRYTALLCVWRKFAD